MDYDERIEGEKLLEKLGTPSIYRSFVMGRMLESGHRKIHSFSCGDVLKFSIMDLGVVFASTLNFDLLFPKANQSTTNQTEGKEKVKSIGNDYADTRNSGPDRTLG